MAETVPVLSAPQEFTTVHTRRMALGPRHSTCVLVLGALWLAIFLASIFAPPLLDDADATHANAARSMALTGDWVTLRVDGIRYLEKAPLPYWLVAISFRIFGFNTFAAHLPEALAVLLLALLGFRWGSKSFGRQTAFYTGVAVLTSAGVFLFTRIFIPEVLLSLFLATALYCFLQSLDPGDDLAFTHPSPSTHSNLYAPDPDSGSDSDSDSARGSDSDSDSDSKERPSFFPRRSLLHPLAMWTALALAVLTKGLVALVFFGGATLCFLLITGDWRRWRSLRPISGLLVFLAIAAPWHVLAGLRNPGAAGGHGFFWFYFVNEHFLRFLGRRLPKDYNKLPATLFWSLHLVWLFPWSLFLPLPLLALYRRWKQSSRKSFSAQPMSPPRWLAADARTSLLLLLSSALILLFFSVSTNQEYYTFPAYLPILLGTCAALVRAEQTFATDSTARRCITGAHVTFTALGAAIAIALLSGLWVSRHLPFVPDIGDLLARRAVGNYTLSMSHFFDLTGPSFAALRLPAALAAIAFLVGPAAAWLFRQQRRHLASTLTIAFTSAVFLVAAHIALVRFGPMLSSKAFATTIDALERNHAVAEEDRVILYGDQSFGSSIPFYLGRTVSLVNGRSSSMLFGSTFPDAPPIFLSDADLLQQWEEQRPILLFVPAEDRADLDRLLPPSRRVLIQESSGKALFTNHPLNARNAPPADHGH